MRLKIICNRPCLDSCVWDVSHSTEDGKGKGKRTLFLKKDF